MAYRLETHDKVFLEGSLEECEAAFKEVINMINAGIKTDYEVSDFAINIDTMIPSDESIPE